ncbi:hypothetical protein [uncultured Dysosmobacter sp.]|uniref:hypothetical protein n=1 Tax=uncultured Dysosmobacter sp. TaxID=2591384 RepID=UPI002617E6C6|nr:hypothetical protein [uncultured Dysosmobacter sp.]
MTELMSLLYDYALETSFSSNLYTAKYRMQKIQAVQLEHSLRRALPPDVLPLLNDYISALDELQHLELEAMFQAAFSMAQDLG